MLRGSDPLGDGRRGSGGGVEKGQACHLLVGKGRRLVMRAALRAGNWVAGCGDSWAPWLCSRF